MIMSLALKLFQELNLNEKIRLFYSISSRELITKVDISKETVINKGDHRES